MKHVLLFLSIFLPSIVTVMGQGYIQPSPDALGLSKFANVPVNLFTGTPSIGLPLGAVSGKELSVGVSLSYNAGGHKVQEVASSVGLGWNLSAGGVITRMVRGLPDDFTNGYCGTANIGEKAAMADPGSTYYDNVRAGTWDGEPDIYFFVIGGRSGKFIIDAAGQAFTMPYQDISIKPGICPDGEWVITDESGIKYKFGGTSASRETTTASRAYPAFNQTHISSWYLTQISNANGTDVIDITYTASGMSYDSPYYTKLEGGSCGGNGETSLTTKITVVTRHPLQIQSSLGRANFSWVSGRRDAPGGVYLRDVYFYNYQNDLISKNRFNYSYFVSDDCNDCEGVTCRRLRLDKVYDLAPDPIATFTYNTTTNLPGRGSNKIDHWGFYNGNTSSSWIPAMQHEVTFTQYVNYPGASRDPHATRSLANLITRIDNRGGSYQVFNFEAHIACNPLSASTANIPIGGARIASIVTHDGNGGSITKSYTYLKEGTSQSSGQYYFLPQNYYIPTSGNQAYKRFSHAAASVVDLNGAHVGYSRVEESVSGLGKTVHSFTNITTNPDDDMSFDLWSTVTVPFTSRAWERGNPIETKVFSQSGALLQRQENKYYHTLANKRSIKAWVIKDESYCSFNFYLPADYSMISRPYVLASQISEVYDPNNSSSRMITVTKHKYDPVNFLPYEVITYDSMLNTTKYVQRVKTVSNGLYMNAVEDDCYSNAVACNLGCDGISDPQSQASCYSACQATFISCLNSPPSSLDVQMAAIYKMRDRHQVAVPVETISYVDKSSNLTVLNASVNYFEIEGPSSSHVNLKSVKTMNQPVLWSLYYASYGHTNGSFVADDNRLRQVGFMSYDQTTGNVLYKTPLAGVTEALTWGYNNNLVTARTTTGTTGMSFTSSFVHKPMVGATTVTDPNARTATTEYDVYNRPVISKDHNGNIVSRSRSHYKNELPGFEISPFRSAALVNETLNLSVVDIAASTGGTPTFLWDFGDGTVVQNGATNVSHSYPSAGTYTIKLSGLNPEYGPATRTMPVVIDTPMEAEFCIDGPILIDYCGTEGAYYGNCTSANNQPSSPVSFTINVSHGCSEYYVYQWSWLKIGIGGVNDMGRCTTASFSPPMSEGTYEVKCEVTDACGNTTPFTTNIQVYKSTPDCPGGIN